MDNRVALIEGKIDREEAGAITISSEKGALAFTRVAEMMDFAKLMAVADKAVPPYLRGNAGACLAVVVQANEWGLSPFSVARQSYLVNDQVAYMGQLIHAVVERRAPLEGRLRFTYEGEGPELRVLVTGKFRGEVDPLVYESPKFKDIKVKNSPLWASDPQQQFSYYGARAWARRYAPDILLGIYAEDELPAATGAENAKDVTPVIEGETIAHRLSAKAAAATGFNAAAIAETVEAVRAEPKVEAEPASATSQKEPTNIPENIPETKSPDPTPSPVASSEAAAVVEPQPEATPVETAAAADQPVSGSIVVTAKPPEPPARESEIALVRGVGFAASLAANDGSPSTIEPPTGADPEPAPALVKPEPAPAKSEPDLPTDGSQYRAYVQATLMQMTDPDDPKKWWGLPAQRKLRNSLPNIDQEILNACMADVKAIAEQLKPKESA